MTEKAFADSLDAVEELAGSLDLRDRLTCLYGLIAPSLGRLERENEPLGDDSPLSTPEVVERVRRAAAGEPVDVDAVYEQLTAVGYVYSENRDPDSHVIAQTAYAAAIWLRLLTGRDLRSTTSKGRSRRSALRLSPSSSACWPGHDRARSSHLRRTPLIPTATAFQPPHANSRRCAWRSPSSLGAWNRSGRTADRDPPPSPPKRCGAHPTPA